MPRRQVNNPDEFRQVPPLDTRIFGDWEDPRQQAEAPQEELADTYVPPAYTPPIARMPERTRQPQQRQPAYPQGSLFRPPAQPQYPPHMYYGSPPAQRYPQGAVAGPAATPVDVDPKSGRLMALVRSKAVRNSGALILLAAVGVTSYSKFSDAQREDKLRIASQYPAVSNDWLPVCGASAPVEGATVTLNGSAEVQIPFQLKAKDPTTESTDAFYSLTATPNLIVKLGICGIRDGENTRQLAAYDAAAGHYVLDRSAIGVTAAPTDIDTKGTNVSAPQKLGVAGALVTNPTDPKYAPSDAATAELSKLMTTTVDSTTKQATVAYTEEMSKILIPKLEASALAIAENQKKCSSTQSAVDGAVRDLLTKYAFGRKLDSAATAKSVFTDSNVYGTAVTGFSKANQPAMDSKLVSVGNMTLSCNANTPSAAPTPASPATATPTANTTTTTGVKP